MHRKSRKYPAEDLTAGRKPVLSTNDQQTPNRQAVEESRKLIQILSEREIRQSFSGPLPPPFVLREYNEIIPGLADRIVSLAEKQTQHRICLETRVIESDIHRSWSGLVSGLLVALACICAGTVCILYGHDVAGTALATGAVGGLVYTFVYGTASRRAERMEKAKAMLGQTDGPATASASDDVSNKDA